jgi:hypothetical protein
MLDLNAPIVPGESAAGIRVGQRIEELRLEPNAVKRLEECERWDFGPVRLWVRAGIVEQIGVREGYRGKVDDTVTIGATLSEIQERVGTVVEDDEDNLIVEGYPGWCFETEGLGEITEIFVYAIAGEQGGCS